MLSAMPSDLQSSTYWSSSRSISASHIGMGSSIVFMSRPPWRIGAVA